VAWVACWSVSDLQMWHKWTIRPPAKRTNQKLTAAYPVSAQLCCAVLLLFCIFFAFAISTVDRESVLSRVLIVSLIGLPALALSFETFGKRIDLEDDWVDRSYFGITSSRRSRSMITRVTHDTGWTMFRIYFSDGSTLWLSSMMRGSADIAQKLDQRTLKPNPNARDSGDEAPPSVV
jgi:hypothetical protein